MGIPSKSQGPSFPAREGRGGRTRLLIREGGNGSVYDLEDDLASLGTEGKVTGKEIEEGTGKLQPNQAGARVSGASCRQPAGGDGFSSRG